MVSTLSMGWGCGGDTTVGLDTQASMDWLLNRFTIAAGPDADCVYWIADLLGFLISLSLQRASLASGKYGPVPPADRAATAVRPLASTHLHLQVQRRPSG